MRSGDADPRSVATTLVMTVGTGIRGGVTGWTKLCSSTVIRPPDRSADSCISS